MAGSPKKKSAKAGGASKSKASKAPAAPAERRPSLVGDAPSADFEAGLLFERFAAAGGATGGNAGGRLDALAFQKMWRERDKLQQLRRALGPSAAGGGGVPPVLPPGGLPGSSSSSGAPQPVYAVPPSSEQPSGVPLAFEAGQLFERYDGDHDGRLSRTEFEGLLNEYLRAKQQQAANNNNPPTPASQPQQPQQQPAAAPALPPAPSYAPPSALPPPPTTPAPAPPAHPGAVPPSSSSSSFTHYDETSGLPLPSDAVYRYGALYGHKVVPLAEAYDRRMHRLQSLLTSHVLPKREQLLQLARRIKVVEDEVRAARLSIERETQADSAAILERLRSSEALKLSALDHRMTQVASQLDAIDRLLAKVGGQGGSSSRDGASGSHQGLTGPPQPQAAPAGSSSSSGQQQQQSGGGQQQQQQQQHMVEVVQSYPELCAAIDRISSTSHTLLPPPGAQGGSGGKAAAGGGALLDVGVSADDLRRETAERVEVLRRCDRYEEALCVKDQMVWSLVQERDRLAGLLAAEEGLRADYCREVEEWASLTAALSQELAKAKAELAGTQALRDEAGRLRREKEALVAELVAARTTGNPGPSAAGGGGGAKLQPPFATTAVKAADA